MRTQLGRVVRKSRTHFECHDIFFLYKNTIRMHRYNLNVSILSNNFFFIFDKFSELILPDIGNRIVFRKYFRK